LSCQPLLMRQPQTASPLSKIGPFVELSFKPQKRAASPPYSIRLGTFKITCQPIAWRRLRSIELMRKMQK
jgi:hypothetical protein